MNCDGHTDREAVGACVNCGKPICLECKVVLGEKVYCNACANTLFEMATAAPAPSANWFRRHLNWTVVLSWLGAYVIAFMAGIVVVMVMYGRNPNVVEADLEKVLTFTGVVVALAWLLPTNGWVLRKKGQSEWHLIWLLVPFGIMVLLGLQNRVGVGGGEAGVES